MGTYPEQSLLEIWQGAERAALMDALAKRDFSKGCQACFELIESENYAGLPAKNYEDLPPKRLPFPSRMEFELENTCNLECVMCRGEFSSAIRKNREGLPPIPKPYGANLLKELKAFIPHLKKAHFLGGEPFLINSYLEIWELMGEMNPDIEISVQTNGTILTDRIRKILKNGRFNIGVSLDSIVAETYAVIRKNGNFAQVWENVLELQAYTQAQDTNFHISYCPMPHNARELPAVIHKCNALNCAVYFNVVYYPKSSSFTSYTEVEMEELIAFLRDHLPELPAGTETEKSNRNAYVGVLQLAQHWLDNKYYAVTSYADLPAYWAGMKAFLLEKEEENIAGTLRALQEKISFLLDTADQQGLRQEAEVKILEVPFQDLFTHARDLSPEQLLQSFRSFALPMQ